MLNLKFVYEGGLGAKGVGIAEVEVISVPLKEFEANLRVFAYVVYHRPLSDCYTNFPQGDFVWYATAEHP